MSFAPHLPTLPCSTSHCAGVATEVIGHGGGTFILLEGTTCALCKAIVDFSVSHPLSYFKSRTEFGEAWIRFLVLAACAWVFVYLSPFV